MVISLVWEMAHRRATPAANQKIRSPPSGKAYTRTNRWAGSDQGPRTRRRSLLTSKSKLRHSVRFIVAFNEIKRSPWRDRPYERRAQKINIWRAHCRGGRASVQMRNNRRGIHRAARTTKGCWRRQEEKRGVPGKISWFSDNIRFYIGAAQRGFRGF